MTAGPGREGGRGGGTYLYIHSCEATVVTENAAERANPIHDDAALIGARAASM